LRAAAEGGSHASIFPPTPKRREKEVATREAKAHYRLVVRTTAMNICQRFSILALCMVTALAFGEYPALAQRPFSTTATNTPATNSPSKTGVLNTNTPWLNDPLFAFATNYPSQKISTTDPYKTNQFGDSAIASFEQMRESAEKGNRFAQNKLALSYAEGTGVDKDLKKAVEWYRKAAEQGLAYAQFNLGCYYDSGMGVDKNAGEAAKWYRKAAEQGLAVAQFNLGQCLATGDGVAENDSEAVSWFHKAADRGLVMAQTRLGSIYENGKGVAQDYAEALKYYRMAAGRGDTLAQSTLGSIYENGRGVPQDYGEAMKYYRMAAENCDSDAQVSLGFMFYDGKGVAQDYVEAYKWFNLSAMSGETNAVAIRDTIQRQMTADQIAEGQHRAATFTAHLAVSKSGDSIPNVGSSQPRPFASGTGFFITADGFLVTNEHVVRNAAQIQLVTSSGGIAAKVVKVDTANDLALLKAEGSFLPLPLVTSRVVRLGNTVATVGFPNIGLQGFAPKLAKGEIAALSGAQDDAHFFQISVPVQPGNSGGALVDERGNVVGVVSAKLDFVAAVTTSGAIPENVNYAVKSSFLLSFLESVPEVSAKLQAPIAKDRKFEDVVKSTEEASVMVVVN
jgi:uncharacterized protein